MECLPYPGSKSDVLDGGVVWKLWGRIKYQPRRCLPPETFFPQPLVPLGNLILLVTDIESSDAPALCERFVA
jgi:hypothetical protein